MIMEEPCLSLSHPLPISPSILSRLINALPHREEVHSLSPLPLILQSLLITPHSPTALPCMEEGSISLSQLLLSLSRSRLSPSPQIPPPLSPPIPPLSTHTETCSSSPPSLLSLSLCLSSHPSCLSLLSMNVHMQRSTVALLLFSLLSSTASTTAHTSLSRHPTRIALLPLRVELN